jgi:hypothetical protein
VGALVVSIAVIVGFVGLRGLLREEVAVTVPGVDYRTSLEYAREEADFAVVGPPALPAGWRATSVEFVPRPARWHLGVLTADEEYVGLEQARRPESSMVAAYIDPDAERGKPVTVEGQTWRSWSDAGGDTALVRMDGELVTLLVSTAPQPVLVDYAASLS